MKRCSKCGVEKPLEDFYRDKSRADGRQRRCVPCTRAGISEWIEANPEKRLEAKRRDYHKHQEKRTAATVKWQTDNSERHLAQQAAYKEANRDRSAETSRAWRQANPERVRDQKLRRRALELNADRRYITDRELMRLTSSPCALCGSHDRIELDHIIPLARGGRHSIGNLQPLCRSHNASKRDRLWIEYRVKAAA